jgi:hypothetical protein
MKPSNLNVCRLKFFCAILLIAVSSAAQESKPTAVEAIGEFSSDLVKKLPGGIWEGSKETFSRTDNITALLLAGGASVIMHNDGADNKIEDNLKHHRRFNDWTDKTLEFAGGPGAHFAATGIWYIISVENQDELNKSRSWTMMKALSITGLTTFGLKAALNNDTPNGKSWAWPSGHTSSSFTAASVLDEFYGPQVGLPAYGFACVVAWRMMDSGDHWGSDVVFGAVLGWVVGHTVAGNDKKLEMAGFNVLPYVANDGQQVMGVNLLRRF